MLKRRIFVSVARRSRVQGESLRLHQCQHQSHYEQVSFTTLRSSAHCRHFSTQLEDDKKKVQLQKKEEEDSRKVQTKIVKELLSHIWPSDHPDSKAIKLRVLASVGCLFGAKFVTISVPFLFKELIDSYGEVSSTTVDVASMGLYIPALVVGYGVARSASAGLQELRNTIFASVTQLAIRNVARDVFRHLHDLDMKFHTNRNTGTLFRVIDRGSRSINFALTSILFNIVPTTFEVGLVSSILAVGGFINDSVI